MAEKVYALEYSSENNQMSRPSTPVDLKEIRVNAEIDRDESIPSSVDTPSGCFSSPQEQSFGGDDESLTEKTPEGLFFGEALNESGRESEKVEDAQIFANDSEFSYSDKEEGPVVHSSVELPLGDAQDRRKKEGLSQEFTILLGLLNEALDRNRVELSTVSAELKQSSALVNAKLEQSSALVNAKLEQSSALVNAKLEQSDAKLEQSLAIVNARLEQNSVTVNAELKQNSEIVKQNSALVSSKLEQLDKKAVEYNATLDQNRLDLNEYLGQNNASLITLAESVENGLISIKTEISKEILSVKNDVANNRQKIDRIELELRDHADTIELELREHEAKIEHTENILVQQNDRVVEAKVDITTMAKQLKNCELKITELSKNISQSISEMILNETLKSVKKADNDKNIGFLITEPQLKKVSVEQINFDGSTTEFMDIKPIRGVMQSYLRNEEKPTFDGANPDNFIKKLDTFVKLSGVSEGEIVEFFHIFLRGKALQWWELSKRPHETWVQLRERFSLYWYNKDRIKEIWNRMVFKPHFDVERFVLKGLQLQNSLRPDASVEKKIEKVVAKLASPVRDFLLLKKSKSVEQFLDDLKEVLKIESLKKTEDDKSFYETRVFNNNNKGNNYKNNFRNNQDTNNNNGNYKSSYNQMSSYNGGYFNKFNKGPGDTLWDFTWDRAGNAYDPTGVCVWEARSDKTVKGRRYVSAISAETVSETYDQALSVG